MYPVTGMAANDVIIVAIDFIWKIWLGLNNVWAGTGSSARNKPMVTFVSPALGQAYFPRNVFHARASLLASDALNLALYNRRAPT